jgi:hypothetical protein
VADLKSRRSQQRRPGGQTQPTNGGLAGRHSHQMADWQQIKNTEIFKGSNNGEFQQINDG